MVQRTAGLRGIPRSGTAPMRMLVTSEGVSAGVPVVVGLCGMQETMLGLTGGVDPGGPARQSRWRVQAQQLEAGPRACHGAAHCIGCGPGSGTLHGTGPRMDCADGARGLVTPDCLKDARCGSRSMGVEEESRGDPGAAEWMEIGEAGGGGARWPCMVWRRRCVPRYVPEPAGLARGR